MARRLALILGFVAVSTYSTFAAAQEKVRFAYSTGSVAFITFLIGDAMGYLQEVGLDAEVIRTGSGFKTLAAVIGGSADVGISTSASVLRVRKEGVDAKAFAALSRQYSSSIVFSKDWAESHGITEDSSMEEKLAALEGMRVAITGPGGTDQILRYFAKQAGLDADSDMTILSVGSDPSVMFAAMTQGRVDGFVTSPPDTTVARRDLGAVVAFNLAAGKIPEFDGYFHMAAVATTDWLDAHEQEA